MFLAVALLVLLEIGGRARRGHHIAAAATCIALGVLETLGTSLKDHSGIPMQHLSGTLIAVTLTGLAIYAAAVLAAWWQHDRR